MKPIRIDFITNVSKQCSLGFRVICLDVKVNINVEFSL